MSSFADDGSDVVDAATKLKAMVEAGNCYAAYGAYRKRLLLGSAIGMDEHYWGILSLARQGFIVEALRQYLQVDWSGETSEELRMLPARLLKELYFQSGERHRFLLQRALELYHREYLETSRPFPGINAAFLSLVAGDRAQAEALADSVLDTLSQTGMVFGPDVSVRSIGALYDQLTYVEANFIRGTGREAAALLPLLAAMPGGRGAVDNCLRQLRRILPLTRERVDIAIAAERQPGMALSYSDAAPDSSVLATGDGWTAAVDRLARRLRVVNCVALFGSLAPGFELALTHAGLASGVRLNLFLPIEVAQYRGIVVAPSGEHWVTRFDEVVRRAETVSSFAPTLGRSDLDRMTVEAATISAGLARLPIHGSNITAGIAVKRMSADGGMDATVTAAVPAEHPGVAQAQGETTQRLAYSIFCDLVGGSRLPERDCVVLFAALYRRVSERLEFAHSLLERNTWGDAVFLVFHDVVEAAEVALDLRRITDGLLPDNPALDISFRVACHYGPAFEIDDPVRGVRAFTGQSVTRVARIEPVTPPGNVYVTQSFAGKLSATQAEGYMMEPVGEINLSKSYGTERVFNLRRATFDITERELRLLRARF